MLTILGILMFIRMYYTVIQSFKPMDELWRYPPKFYVVKATLSNYADMFKAMSNSWFPFTLYIQYV